MSMKYFTIAIVVAFGGLRFPSDAFAAPDTYLGCLMPAAMASDVHPSFLWLSTAVSKCNSRIYFDAEDKEIFAVGTYRGC